MATRIPGKTQRVVNWEGLLRKAILKAESAGDKRLATLRAALSEGKAATTLKRMGIIGDNDLVREFPLSKK